MNCIAAFFMEGNMAVINGNNIFRMEVKRPSIGGVTQTEILNIVTDYNFMENKPLKFSSRSAFPLEGNTLFLYIATDEDNIYYWTGSAYAKLTLKPADLTNQFVTLGTDQMITGQKTFSTPIISTVSATAPFVVASNKLVTNLNADLLDNQQGSYYLNFANFTNLPDTIDGGDLDIV
jgi:hypothetical protein